ncbi:MAG: hypothetical protein ACREOH_11585 [Candidatus Entotheonellia bacterium]
MKTVFVQALCRLSLGEAQVLAGHLEEAHALELYRAMEMTFWLPQAEATLAQVG